MFNCKNLFHPFQTDPGISQRQRVIDGLLSDSLKIDGRSMAELLNYFYQLSGNVNYYDKQLNTSDWRPFFTDSVPFLLASIHTFDSKNIESRFNAYQLLAKKQLSTGSLQLNLFFIYYHCISRINTWQRRINGSGLALEPVFQQLLSARLKPHLLNFSKLANAAARWHCVKRIDFSRIAENETWGLTARQLMEEECVNNQLLVCASMQEFLEKMEVIFRAFMDAIASLSLIAPDFIEQSLEPDREELSKLHTPHLALLFTFLRLYQRMQDALNSKTREHLDFFYKEVLRIKPRPAEPDKAHIVFELQKILRDQLQKYKVDKGVLLKDGKDDNKQEILFSVDDEIIVNEAQVTDKRTLFLNNNSIKGTVFLEGTYIAPDATKADGIKAGFKDEEPKNWYTLGNKLSKFTPPGQTAPKAHPHARLGFILASPVLLLNEGERTVEIKLACRLNDPACVTELTYFAAANFLAPNNLLNPILNLPTRPFSILLSGEKDWVVPDTITKLEISSYNATTGQFNLQIHFKINAGSPAITFFDKEKLKEDFNTTLPLVKIELIEDIRLGVVFEPVKHDCCLEKDTDINIQPVSLYHFFRNVIVLNTSTIDVKVCGVKKLVVQNDENVMDVNAPIYPFGARPEVADFSMLEIRYGITLQFIADLENLAATRAIVKQKLLTLLGDTGYFAIGGKITEVEAFITGFNPALNAQEDAAFRKLLITDHKIYRLREGPNFYIGSQEVFCKKWTKVDINLKWKDKPVDFHEYYKGYRLIKVNNNDVYGIDENDFEYRLSFLNSGIWEKKPQDPVTKQFNDKLFEQKITAVTNPVCAKSDEYEQVIRLKEADKTTSAFTIENIPFTRYDITTRNGFIRLNLRNQDFGHKDYPFVLARQMIAFGKLPETSEGAVYYDNQGPFVINTDQISTDIDTAEASGITIEGLINAVPGGIDYLAGNINDLIQVNEADQIRGILRPPPPNTNQDLKGQISALKSLLTTIKTNKDDRKKPQAVIPNEPWTPIISAISINYTATATITDMELIHLYPYADTYLPQVIAQQPSLFPVFCDEGTLFLGIQNLVPGSNLNILFQLAEATADSEAGKERVNWQYLDTNVWKDLRPGFEILDDATNGLRTSGIIKLAIPGNITTGNTIMPKDLYWIKASVAKNSKTVSETIDIHTQAIRATFTNAELNDKKRLSKPLAAGSIAKLNTADANIKKVNQFYKSFGGKTNESEGPYYTRVSELLRHKGRAIQKWDYERLALEKFSELYKVKCINHSFKTDSAVYNNDIPYAPGYIILAVIPDLTKLQAGNSFEPRVPLSLLDNIEEYFKKITSPFVRLKAANPRYEKVNFELKVQFLPGKDKAFYTQQLKDDIRQFLAPWAVGEFSKLSFGQPVSRSGIIGLLESKGYVDFIKLFKMDHENNPLADHVETIYPLTPRSILIAGEITVLDNDPIPADWCTQGRGCDKLEYISGVRKHV